MTHRPAGPLLLPLTLILLAAGSARAGEVEVAPFFGLRYGGSLVAPSGRKGAIDVGPQYGATLDVAIAQRWSIELLYARQESEVASDPRIGLAVERYMAGVREEKEVGRGRFLGVALLGLTRIVPDGPGADERFTVAGRLQAVPVTLGSDFVAPNVFAASAWSRQGDRVAGVVHGLVGRALAYGVLDLTRGAWLMESPDAEK